VALALMGFVSCSECALCNKTEIVPTCSCFDHFEVQCV